MILLEFARPADVPSLVAGIHALADEEGFPDPVVVSEDTLASALFGDDTVARCLVARDGPNLAAFAIFYSTFSTTLGKRGIHLDDLYVWPIYRGQGLGQRLLARLARQAHNEGGGRLEWWALAWNEKARRLYDRLGARHMSEIVLYRVAETEFATFAAEPKL